MWVDSWVTFEHVFGLNKVDIIILEYIKQESCVEIHESYNLDGKKFSGIFCSAGCVYGGYERKELIAKLDDTTQSNYYK